MEQFVEMLYNRLESNKELQMQLFIIMQNAINEMHNNGIIAGLTGEAAQLVHDPDPEVRVTEKTKIAKAVGKQFIPHTFPAPAPDGLIYVANVNYDPRFVNSITLCFQGGIEALRMASASNPQLKLDKYYINIVSGGEDLEAFKTNIAQLNKMYEDISIVILPNGGVTHDEKSEISKNEHENGVPVNTPAKKKGFFEKLFGRI